LTKVFWQIFNQWFLIGIGIAILLAHLFPNVARSGGVLKAQWTVHYLVVAIIFFISGLSLPLAHLKKQASNFKLHIVTQGLSLLVFPTLVFGIVCAARTAGTIDPYVLVGMVVMGCMPTTVASNVVMTTQSGGDPSAATVEVLLGNFLVILHLDDNQQTSRAAH